jgi:hypothetical protein
MLRTNGIAAVCVDDERPPSAFVSVTGTVIITTEVDVPAQADLPGCE